LWACSLSFHELLLIVVVKDDVGADDGLDDFWGLSGDGRDAVVVNGEDSDGVAAVYLVCKLGFCDVLVE